MADAEGNLYGTAEGGPEFPLVFYKASDSGEFTVLFKGDVDRPLGYLCLASDGWFYGAASPRARLEK
jgi:hypothetical protein